MPFFWMSFLPNAIMLNVISYKCLFVECDLCQMQFWIFLLNVILLNVILLNVILLNVIYAGCYLDKFHFIVCHSSPYHFAASWLPAVILLNAVLHNAVLMNVMAPHMVELFSNSNCCWNWNSCFAQVSLRRHEKLETFIVNNLLSETAMFIRQMYTNNDG